MITSPTQRSIVLGIALIAGLSCITAMGVLNSSNLAMIDRLFHWFPNQQATPPILLISTTEIERNTPDLLPNLIKTLTQDNPHSIYLLGQSVIQTQASDTLQPWLENLTLVDSVTRLKQAEERPRVANNVYMTAVTMQASYFRQWHKEILIEETPYPAFQSKLAGLDDPVELGFLSNTSDIIDFSMEDGFIPIVTAKRVLKHGLATSMVKDKVILIGDALEPGEPGFTVPIRTDIGISQLELQGYALHSALAQRFLSSPSYLMTLLGTLIIASISILLFQWFPPHISALYSIFICVGIAVTQWFSVKFNTVILPASEWIIAQIFILLAVYQLRRNKEEQALNRIIAETNSRLSERVQPLNFNRSDDPWKKILSLVNQQLNLRRSIFLEKINGEHRVKEIEALGCSINDISEFRRDYQRSPYSDALKVNRPIIPFRDYFNEVKENEIQYLIPLIFVNDLLGFWALTLIPDERFDKDLFENNLINFSNQISELLYHRKQWKLHDEKSKNPWRKLISLEIGQSLHVQLSQSVTLLQNRLNTLEHVFNGLSTAAIVYDVFGQVLHTNSMIEYLSRINDIAIYNLTAMELLARAGDMSLDDARKKLRYVTLKNQTIAIVSSTFSSHTSHLLRIRPLLSSTKANSDQVHPFQILGILFEFIDISQIQQNIEIRQDITHKYLNEIRNYLSAMTLASRQLQKKSNADHNQWLIIIKEKIEESSKLTRQIEDELNKQVYMSDQQVVPVNIAPAISRALEAVEERAESKDIKINYREPELNTLSYIEIKTFEKLISSILNMLIQDSNHESVISVFILDVSEENNNKININFSNMGNGIPKEQLDKALLSPQVHVDDDDDYLTQVTSLSRQMKSWGGSISIQTDIGSGFSIDITLKIFSFSSTIQK
ncbi:MAG: HAMP domain-containing histidine kinase [Bermanella sp.]